MEIGKANERAMVLYPVQNDQGIFYQQEKEIWVCREKLKGKNIFSSLGLGAESFRFTFRKQPFSLHNALLCGGRHYFLTSVTEIARTWYEAEAALVYPVTCILEREKSVLDERNRPVHQKVEELAFTGFLTEKYFGYQEEKSHADSQTDLVLVTPKLVKLSAGDLIDIKGSHFTVAVCHTLDEYKQEYEMRRKVDV